MIAAPAPVLGFAADVLATDEEFDPNTVTPGIWGFVLTFLLMVAVVLLILDMVRRMRRVNMRAQVQAQLAAEAEAAARDAELAEADGQAIDAGDNGPATDVSGEEARRRRAGPRRAVFPLNDTVAR